MAVAEGPLQVAGESDEWTPLTSDGNFDTAVGTICWGSGEHSEYGILVGSCSGGNYSDHWCHPS